MCRLLLWLDSQATPNLVEIKQLLSAAEEAGLPVCGLYLGGLASQRPEDLPVLATWLRLAASLRTWAAHQLGLTLGRLHIGELAALAAAVTAPGHVAEKGEGFGAEFCVARVGEMLDELFPAHLGVEISAGATRFLVGPAVTLAARVVAARERIVHAAAGASSGDRLEMHYYINEGVFGALSGILWDNNNNNNNNNSSNNTNNCPAVPFPLGGVKNRKVVGHRYFGTAIRGPSGDELDLIADDILLPRLDEDDWLLFPGLGCLNDTGYGRSSCVDGSTNHIYRRGDDAEFGCGAATAAAVFCAQDLGYNDPKAAAAAMDFATGGGDDALPPFCDGFSVDLDTFQRLAFSTGGPDARPDFDLKNTFLFEE